MSGGNPWPGNIDNSQDLFAVNVERLVAASPARIWKIIGTQSGMRQWMNMALFQTVANGRILLDSSGASEAERLIVYGRVTEFAVNRRIAFTWRVLREDGALWPDFTELLLTLEPQAKGTLVRLVHSGFEKLADYGDNAYSVYHHCWVQTPYLERLSQQYGASA